MASAELEPGVFFESHIIKPPDLALQEVWIYHPNPLPSQRMSLVVVPPAGGNFISAPGLGWGDEPEHLPYVHAGFAVASFTMQGALPSDDPSEVEALIAASAFRDGQAGVGNARAALDFVLSRLPIDPSRIYAAGHSSAATLVLLFAAMDSRVGGVAAYAPAVDIKAYLGPELVQYLDEVLPGYEGFLDRSSPVTQIPNLRVPVLLFHAKDDELIPYQEALTFAEALSQANQQVQFVSAEQGGHYESMIEAGIPAGLKWMKSLADP